jgi:DNA-directed RNA polymerase subunit RPC12/RpoP
MWQIEHQCPQCGAPVVLEETDHILTCPYCRARLFIAARDYAALYLPPAPGITQELLYLPYWRFKGMSFSCRGTEVHTKIVDMSRLAVPAAGVPLTLGVRPQALKLKFVAPDTAGTFIKPAFSLQDSAASIEGQLPASAKAPRLHQACIGETASVIYAPLFIDGGRLYDGILKKTVAQLPPDDGLAELAPCDEREKLRLSFLPCLCPDCGWSLEGEKESLVLLCKNCTSAWSATGDGLGSVSCAQVCGASPDDIMLPFWKITAQVQGLQLASYADLLRLNNAPEVITPQKEQQELAFWVPAFKIAPELFLLTAQRMTFFQDQGPLEERLGAAVFHPVTLPPREAMESVTPLLAQCAMPRRDFFPKLPQISVQLRAATLVYVPFTPSGSELTHTRMPLSINRNALKWGLSL